MLTYVLCPAAPPSQPSALEKSRSIFLAIHGCSIIGALLILATSSASAAGSAPRTLRVPVVGLRYEIAALHFDPLPTEVQRKCPTLADDENMRGVFWIYGSARDGSRTYYLVGGYGIRSHPEAPTFPRYETFDSGIVFRIDGNDCVIFGDANEVFETRYLAETPQPMLQQLAANLALRWCGLSEERMRWQRPCAGSN